jgi:hypothetical protein
MPQNLLHLKQDAKKVQHKMRHYAASRGAGRAGGGGFGEDSELREPHAYRLKRKPRMQVSGFGEDGELSELREDGEFGIRRIFGKTK